MRKLKIKCLPKMAKGGGGRSFNQLSPNAMPDRMNEAPLKVNTTLQPVSEEIANLEAEKGETAFIPNVDGLPAHFTIGGKRHSEGGTPLSLPEDSFIFSDTKSMILKDKELLSQFGETKPKTFADIAKKYDLNKYRKILADPTSDKMQVETAEKMIENYNMLLGKLALAQEAMKGFPQGIPFIAYPYMMVNAIEPDSILPQTNSTSRQVKIKGLPTAQKGGPTKGGYNPDRSRKETYDYNQAFLDAYLKGAESGSYMPQLPVTYTEGTDGKIRSRQSVQSQMSGKTNIYGDDEVLNLDDFQKRHAWYFKNKPNWDPSSKEDVADFQKSYNVKAQEFGLPSYFTTDGPQGTRLDSKFGEHTWSAPGFNTPDKKAAAKVEAKAMEPLKPIEFNPDPIAQPYGYYPQDIANLATAIGTQIPRMQTWYPNVPFREMDPIFLKEDYSPIMESANLAIQGNNAYSGRPSGVASNLMVMGKAARAAADHNLQVANINAGIYNDAQKFNAAAGEANAKFNAANAQQDFDARQLYDADFVKAKNKKRANVTGLFNNMLTNATDTYNLNLMSPYYKINPEAAGMAALYNTEALKPNKHAYDSEVIKMYRALKEETGADDKVIFDFLARSKERAPKQPEYYNPYDVSVGPYY